MRKVCKSIFFTGVFALMAVLLTNGMASAVTGVTNVQPNADYQNGNIEIDATITCDNTTDLIVFEAVQNQGRHTAIGVLEFSCANAIPDPLVIPIFENFTFRSGPFTLWVRIFDTINGTFLKGQGFKLKGK
jgi:hypothetical protein